MGVSRGQRHSPARHSAVVRVLAHGCWGPRIHGDWGLQPCPKLALHAAPAVRWFRPESGADSGAAPASETLPAC